MNENPNSDLRAPAVPLVTVDPYFSIWSTGDRLFDDHTRHWTGARMGMVGLARIDGRVWRFCGRTKTDSPSWRYQGEPPGMTQESVTISATTTAYRFRAAGIELTASFATPLLLDDPEVLSRPVSYATFAVASIDNEAHQVSLYFDISGEAAVDSPDQRVVWGRRPIANHGESCFLGTWSQNVLGKRGDDVRIDWGYVHLLAPEANHLGVHPAEKAREHFGSSASLPSDEMPSRGSGEPLTRNWPVLASTFELGEVRPGSDGTSPSERTVLLAYEDIHSIEYFGNRLSAFCFREGATFEQILVRALEERAALVSRCSDFDREVFSEADHAGGARYADICSLAYRQAIAAHKLVADTDGRPLFFSKECFSNGSIGTVDVTYPSVPIFFRYNPTFVEAMLFPIFRFARSDNWPKPYAPHDVGTYPRANGQTYGVYLGQIDETRQMPVEECGNMIIITAALRRVREAAGESCTFAEDNWDLLSKWAEYLLEHGYDPAHQLCTDDFAGHLARNTNLSVKTIIALAAFAELCERSGRNSEAERFESAARNFAVRWARETLDGEHHRLTFDAADSWSLKYNLIWDKIFGFGLFGDDVFEREVAWYRRQANRYGTPLDSRATFTKGDWILWVASLSENPEDFTALSDPIWYFLNDTPSRTPFSDWYGTTDATEQSFHHRSVVGGMFMKIWKDQLLHRHGSREAPE